MTSRPRSPARPSRTDRPGPRQAAHVIDARERRLCGIILCSLAAAGGTILGLGEIVPSWVHTVGITCVVLAVVISVGCMLRAFRRTRSSNGP